MWFQNRRAKDKRSNKKDSISGDSPPTTPVEGGTMHWTTQQSPTTPSDSTSPNQYGGPSYNFNGKIQRNRFTKLSCQSIYPSSELILASFTFAELDEDLQVTTPVRHLQCVQPMPKQQHLQNQDLGHRQAPPQQMHPRHIMNEEPPQTTQQQPLSSEHNLIGMIRD